MRHLPKGPGKASLAIPGRTLGLRQSAYQWGSGNANSWKAQGICIAGVYRHAGVLVSEG